MNYHSYVNTIQPSAELKDKISAQVRAEISRKNISVRKRKTAAISTAACLAIIATTAFAGRELSENVILPSEITASSNQGSTEPVSKSGKIKINTAEVEAKYGTQKIVIDDNVYVQYCSNGNKAEWGNDNGEIVIDEDDIGELICELDEKKLVDFDHWLDYQSLSPEQAKNNTFYCAEIYEYKKCKNKTVLLAKAKDEYYMFTLSDFKNKKSSNDVIAFYSAYGENKISKIAVTESGGKGAITISDDASVIELLALLEVDYPNIILQDAISKGYLDDYAELDCDYAISIEFEDGTGLVLNVYKSFFSFATLNFGEEYGYYELNDSNYSSISQFIEKRK